MSYRDDAERTPGLLDFGQASVGGFVVIVIIFLLVLTAGYLNYARLVWPGAPLLAQTLLGLLVAFGALVLARATAAARLAQRAAGPGASPTWLLFFALLLTISALGTMNALFYFFEGDQVADQRVEQARQQLAQLKAEGTQALQVPEYEKLQADVTAGLGALSEQIFSVGSGGSCGIGVNAEEKIRDLARVLPGFKRIAFTDQEHDCNKQKELKNIANLYAQDADRLLRASPVYQQHQIARREAVGTALNSSVDAAMQSLADALSSTSNTSRGVARDYRPLQSALMQAADTYRQQLAEVKTVIGKPLMFGDRVAPETLEIEDVTQLGNIAYILKSIVLRLDRPQTYFYFIGAITLDAFMVWAFITVMTDMGVAGRGSRRPTIRQDAEVTVHYLWTRGRT